VKRSVSRIPYTPKGATGVKKIYFANLCPELSNNILGGLVLAVYAASVVSWYRVYVVISDFMLMYFHLLFLFIAL
jgi:hypothetical protein